MPVGGQGGIGGVGGIGGIVFPTSGGGASGTLAVTLNALTLAATGIALQTAAPRSLWTDVTPPGGPRTISPLTTPAASTGGTLWGTTPPAGTGGTLF